MSLLRSAMVLSAVLAFGCSSAPTPAAESDAGVVVDSALPDAAVDLPDARSIDAAPGNEPGKHVHHVTIGGIERELIVYVPTGAARATAPVVFMFHGTSGDGEKFYDISGWREKADTEGLIAVFPSALTYCFHEDENFDGDFDDPDENKITTKWAAGALGTPRLPLCTAAELARLTPAQRARVDHPLQDDVAFVREMLTLLSTQYVTDAKRIYASGFSNGASMTSRLSVDLPDRFAALHAAAGALNIAPVPASSPLSFVMTTGDIDDCFLEQVGLPALPLSESLLTSVPTFKTNRIDPLRTVLQLNDQYTYDERVVGGKKVIRFSYASSTGSANNVLQALVIEGLGHQYPNGKNHPLVMTDYVWEFFRTRKKP